MCIHRLPGAKVAAAILWAILLLGMAVAAAFHLWKPWPERIDEETTMSLLRTEVIRFTVARGDRPVCPSVSTSS